MRPLSGSRNAIFVPMTNRRLNAVIFDLFGTLVELFSRTEHERVLASMAEALSVDCDEFARMWAYDTSFDRTTGAFATIDENIEHICRSLGAPVDEQALSRAVQIRTDHTRTTLQPRPDAVATLTDLKDSGYTIGLLSNCSADVPLVWPETPFASLLESPVFSCSVGLKKPDPKIYTVACRGLNVEAGDCLYVGDGSDRELTGALEAGMTPVLLRISLEDAYDASRPDVEEWQGLAVSSLSQVPGLLK